MGYLFKRFVCVCVCLKVLWKFKYVNALKRLNENFDNFVILIELRISGEIY